MNQAAIILAAGASRRMGQPKALLVYEAETFVDRLAGLFARCGAEVVVVLGHHAAAIRAGMRRKVTFSLNTDPDRGMLSSLQCGLMALPDGTESFFFTPVDYPAIAFDTVERLNATLGASQLAIPRYQGRRGHPVLCRRELADEFLECRTRASDVIHAHVGHTAYVDVEDAGILTDVDDPAAYQALLAAGVPR